MQDPKYGANNYNLINLSNDDLIGFINDLIKYFNDLERAALNDHNESALESINEILSDLNKHDHSMNLYRLSFNNGMGFTLTEIEVK